MQFFRLEIMGVDSRILYIAEFQDIRRNEFVDEISLGLHVLGL